MFPFDRWLVRLYGLIAAIGALWMGLWLLNFAPAVQLGNYFVTSQIDWLYVGLAVLLVISIRYLAFRIQPRRAQAFIRELEGGQIRIGHHAVREIVIRTARQVRGVKQLQVKIDESAQGLMIHVDVQAEPVDLNEMGESIQREVGQAIRNMTSLAIASVNVHVATLAPDSVQK